MVIIVVFIKRDTRGILLRYWILPVTKERLITNRKLIICVIDMVTDSL
jgi:hypothetical protein